MRAAIASTLLVLLTGCAAPGLYNWGGYDDALYAGYKDPARMEQLRIKLETHIAAMKAVKQKVAPGLYAELGTLYLQSGAPAKAIAFYKEEQQAWPESRHLMTSLITNLERKAEGSGGTQ